MVAIIAVLVVIVVILGAFAFVYGTRLRTMDTIGEVESYDDGFGLYSMDVKYEYDLDRIISRGITDDQSYVDAIVKEAIPYLPVHIEAPQFGCTAFSMSLADGDKVMGRSYDFKNDTSAMLVRCDPKDGYSSIGFAALDNIGTKNPSSFKEKLACLTAPFVCLDGINEKGVSIAVLTLDSKPTHQDSGKPTIGTTLAIRLVLDRAASTQEAVELLEEYDMYATSGRDYHFYITDSTGDGRVVEYDCDDDARKMTVTPTEAVTNFYYMYTEKVQPDQRNEQYGHGKERYNKAMGVIEATRGTATVEDAWTALNKVAQPKDPNDPTSNTQWSIVYNNTDLTATISIRMHWDDRFEYDMESGKFVKLES